jgi:hypothetical protein
VDWLVPATGECVQRSEQLVVAASAPGGVATVRFAVDGHRATVVREDDQGVWRTAVSSRSLARGPHTVTATAVDKHGGSASQRRIVRMCRG